VDPQSEVGLLRKRASVLTAVWHTRWLCGGVEWALFKVRIGERASLLGLA